MKINEIENFDLEVKKVIEQWSKNEGFKARKLTDNPTDDFMVTPRGYVNLNGTAANRPKSSVATTGQRYFATDLNQLMIFNSTTQRWYNGVASVVAGPS